MSRGADAITTGITPRSPQQYEERSLRDGRGISRILNGVRMAPAELATGWQAERTGDPAVFPYFADPTPESGTGRAGFGSTRGRSADAVYGVFTAYRVRLSQPC